MKAGRAAGIAGATGAVLPDIPILVGTAANFGPIILRGGWGSLDIETFLGTIPPNGLTVIALHSAVPLLALLALYSILGLGSGDQRRILLWFLIGWLGHTVVDFLTHAANVRPLFWPLSGWTWNSPVSYYDPLHYGRQFFLTSHALMLLIMATLLIRRLRGKQSSNPAHTNS